MPRDYFKSISRLTVTSGGFTTGNVSPFRIAMVRSEIVVGAIESDACREWHNYYNHHQLCDLFDVRYSRGGWFSRDFRTLYSSFSQYPIYSSKYRNPTLQVLASLVQSAESLTAFGVSTSLLISPASQRVNWLESIYHLGALTRNLDLTYFFTTS